MRPAASVVWMAAGRASRSRQNASSFVRRRWNNVTSTRVTTMTVATLAWAPGTRSVIGTAVLPNHPMLKVVAQMIIAETRNPPAIANVGWQRAASHNSSGSTAALGLNVSQDPLGWAIRYALASP